MCPCTGSPEGMNILRNSQLCSQSPYYFCFPVTLFRMTCIPEKRCQEARMASSFRVRHTKFTKLSNSSPRAFKKKFETGAIIDSASSPRRQPFYSKPSSPTRCASASSCSCAQARSLRSQNSRCPLFLSITLRQDLACAGTEMVSPHVASRWFTIALVAYMLAARVRSGI